MKPTRICISRRIRLGSLCRAFALLGMREFASQPSRGYAATFGTAAQSPYRGHGNSSLSLGARLARRGHRSARFRRTRQSPKSACRLRELSVGARGPSASRTRLAPRHGTSAIDVLRESKRLSGTVGYRGSSGFAARRPCGCSLLAGNPGGSTVAVNTPTMGDASNESSSS